MTAGDETCPHSAGPRPAVADLAEPDPFLVAPPGSASRTGLIVFPRSAALPAVWAGPMPPAGIDPADAAQLLVAGRPCPLLPEHGAGWFGRAGLTGHRL